MIKWRKRYDNEIEKISEKEKKEIVTLYIRTLNGKTLNLNTKRNNAINKVKEEIKEIIGIPQDQQRLFFKMRLLEDNLKIDDYVIANICLLYLVIISDEKNIIDNIKNEQPELLSQNKMDIKIENNNKQSINKINEIQTEIKNVENNDELIKSYVILDHPFKKEKNNSSYTNISIKENNENKINNYDDFFNTKLLKRIELNVNLIYFDSNLTNKEKFRYFNDFKVDVVGGFHGIDDLNILKQYLEKLKDKNIPFIVVSSGTSGKEVISICKQYSFVKEIIIFCRNYDYNEHYIKENP
jgi:acetone carboxylase gamma subunit